MKQKHGFFSTKSHFNIRVYGLSQDVKFLIRQALNEKWIIAVFSGT